MDSIKTLKEAAKEVKAERAKVFKKFMTPPATAREAVDRQIWKVTHGTN